MVKSVTSCRLVDAKHVQDQIVKHFLTSALSGNGNDPETRELEGALSVKLPYSCFGERAEMFHTKVTFQACTRAARQHRS